MLALPALAQEQGGFKVTPGTGFESGSTGAISKAPSPKKPRPVAAGEKKPTEITASKETSFDAKTRTAIFVGDVKVVDSQFTLTCEKLMAYIKKPKEENPASDKSQGQKEPASSGTSAKPEEKKDDNKGEGGLDRVVAEGNVVITQEKADPNSGEVTRYIGKGAKADYVAATGDMTLSGWPQIQQGLNTQVATEEGTIMVMNRSGQLRTIGQSKTVIQADPGTAKSDKNKGETTGAAPTPSNP